MPQIGFRGAINSGNPQPNKSVEPVCFHATSSLQPTLKPYHTETLNPAPSHIEQVNELRTFSAASTSQTTFLSPDLAAMRPYFATGLKIIPTLRPLMYKGPRETPWCSECPPGRSLGPVLDLALTLFYWPVGFGAQGLFTSGRLANIVLARVWGSRFSGAWGLGFGLRMSSNAMMPSLHVGNVRRHW